MLIHKKIDHRNLAFSLLEILIVVAIIGILSTIFTVRYARMKDNQDLQLCRANIMELAQILEAYKVSNGFYPIKDKNGGYIGSSSNANSYRLIATFDGSEDETVVNSAGARLFPPKACPKNLREANASTDPNTGKVIAYSYSYGLRVRADEYTIICFTHSVTSTKYAHPKDQPAGFVSDNLYVQY